MRNGEMNWPNPPKENNMWTEQRTMITEDTLMNEVWLDWDNVVPGKAITRIWIAHTYKDEKVVDIFIRDKKEEWKMVSCGDGSSILSFTKLEIDSWM